MRDFHDLVDQQLASGAIGLYYRRNAIFGEDTPLFIHTLEESQKFENSQKPEDASNTYWLFTMGALAEINNKVMGNKMSLNDFISNDSKNGDLLIDIRGIFYVEFLPKYLVQGLTSMDWITGETTDDSMVFNIDDAHFLLHLLSEIPSGRPVAHDIWQAFVPHWKQPMPSFLYHTHPRSRAASHQLTYDEALIRQQSRGRKGPGR